MRRAVIIVLIVTLGACSHGRGDRKAAANGDAAAPAEKKPGKDRSLDLPGGLGGDTAHRAYTGDAPK